MSLEELTQGFDLHIEQFYRLQERLKDGGILSFFQEVVRVASFPSESLYLDLLQLVEIVCENTHSFDDYLPFLQKLKQEDPESEILKAHSKSEEDAIQVMTMHVSKGLEFTIVFPVGLMSVSDIKEEEERSEKMRQLYVALTRAKKRLYIPVSEKENTPIHFFLSSVLKGESLESFIENHPYFSLVQCDKKIPFQGSTPAAKSITAITPAPLVFAPLTIHSYSSLAQKREFVSDQQLRPDDSIMPTGSKTGSVLHQIFERLDFEKIEGIPPFLALQLKGTHLEPWMQTVETIVHNALYFPLPAPSGTFCLADVDPKMMKREMEFLYSTHSPSGFMKGFIDLFFEHRGHYYIIDWKSNFLESYSCEKLREAVDFYDYGLQAKLYLTAAQRYLSIFDRADRLEGIFYMFLRGLDIEKQEGIFFVPCGRHDTASC